MRTTLTEARRDLLRRVPLFAACTDKELAEVKMLEEFLPAAVPPDEIRVAVRAAIAGGATDLGQIMGRVMPQYKGRADGKLINQIAREELSAAV